MQSNLDWESWRASAATQEFLEELNRRRDVVFDRLPIVDETQEILKLGRKMGYIEALNDILAFGRGDE